MVARSRLRSVHFKEIISPLRRPQEYNKEMIKRCLRLRVLAIIVKTWLMAMTLGVDLMALGRTSVEGAMLLL